MKTNDLISILAKDTVNDPVPTQSMFNSSILIGIGLFLGMLVSGFLFGTGVRENFLQHEFSGLVWAKQLVPVLLVISLIPMAKQIYRPEINSSILTNKSTYLAIGLMLIVGLVGLSQSQNIGVSIKGNSNFACLFFIPAFSIPIFWNLLKHINQGAPSKPWQAGLISGLIAGSFGAIIFAFVCTEDDPLYFAIWYSVAILACGIFGAIIGRKVLSW